MTLFAHNSVGHATSAESVSHTTSLIIGANIATILNLIVIARLLSKSNTEKAEEK